MITKRARTLIAACAMVAAAALGTSASGAMAKGYVQKNLVSDGKISAVTTDPNLLNPWGIAFFPGGPFWISDNNA